MISVKVKYTVKPEFADQNKANINLFLNDFKKLQDLSFLYNVYVQSDGLTFIHISMYETEAIQSAVLNVPSFIHFQQERDASGLTNPPTIEQLSLVGSSLGLVTK